MEKQINLGLSNGLFKICIKKGEIKMKNILKIKKLSSALLVGTIMIGSSAMGARADYPEEEEGERV